MTQARLRQFAIFVVEGTHANLFSRHQSEILVQQT